MKAIPVILTLLLAAVVAYRENECPPDQEWDWTIEKLLRHENCEMFYKCTFGQPVEKVCPSGLWFCLKNMRCEWSELVDCEDRIVPTTTTSTTTSIPTTTTTTTPTPTTTTTTTTTPAPTTTTTTTTTPAPTTTTTTTTTTTPAPTTTTTTTTTPAPTTTTTTTTPAPTTTSTTTQAPTTPGFRPNGCPVNPHVHWLLPHETDCNLFYYCVWGELVLRQCPSSLHFNRIIQVCDWPRDAGCTNASNNSPRGILGLFGKR